MHGREGSAEDDENCPEHEWYQFARDTEVSGGYTTGQGKDSFYPQALRQVKYFQHLNVKISFNIHELIVYIFTSFSGLMVANTELHLYIILQLSVVNALQKKK